MLLKNKNCEENISTQQRHILRYALANGFGIQATEIDNSLGEKVLEERKWFRGFLRSLKPNDTVLVYDLWSLTNKIDEIVKIFECLLRRNITLHICNKRFIISNQTPLFNVLELLAKQRESNLNPAKEIHAGRPKGRMSRSKFDNNRAQIVGMLEEGISVNYIAKEFGFSRSSLKDYINSRELKELAAIKKTLPKHDNKKIDKLTARQSDENPQKECALIKDTP
ncbi:MAG: recombinase family protein [Campylobacteraceae bacterium]|jgi:DNA invertase Pin-like site-specific DNA recombinase|nr:recombinase family protein [Campylobacteraceae bacterium]